MTNNGDKHGAASRMVDMRCGTGSGHHQLPL